VVNRDGRDDLERAQDPSGLRKPGNPSDKRQASHFFQKTKPSSTSHLGMRCISMCICVQPVRIDVQVSISNGLDFMQDDTCTLITYNASSRPASHSPIYKDLLTHVKVDDVDKVNMTGCMDTLSPVDPLA
jgi:hypothetical protein